MTNFKNILYQKQRKGVLITLNRPNALNAMNEELMNELDQALSEAETDPEIRAVVITGADGAFSVGEDISGDDPETAWPYGIPAGTSLNATYNKFRDADRKDILDRQAYRWQYPKPIIAGVSGWCLGAGSWLALTCHITIAADDAVFGLYLGCACRIQECSALFTHRGSCRCQRGFAHRSRQSGGGERSAAGDVLSICRTRRPCAARDCQNQSAHFNFGHGDDGLAQSMDAQCRTRRDGAPDQA
jgi:hypothetical protein